MQPPLAFSVASFFMSENTTPSKLRRQIAHEAARLMYSREESEYFRAKQKASRRICQGWVKPADLPSNAEIREEIQAFARMHEGDNRTDNLREMRFEALRLMHVLRRYKPRLIGSVLTGHIRQGSDIDLHVFSDSLEGVCDLLEEEGLLYTVERKRVRKAGVEQVFTHIHVEDRYPFELTIYGSEWVSYHFKSSITGKAMERASIAELEQFLATAYPDVNQEEALAAAGEQVDRFTIYRSLLLPLEQVKQNPAYHPEGDALYHSLQVFELAKGERPYDEELLLAALLHDVGKGIDPYDHTAAGLEALGTYITPRTHWLIEHHMVAHEVASGTAGARSVRRLKESEDFEELMLLQKCDKRGRVPGGSAPELEEALDYLKELSQMCDG